MKSQDVYINPDKKITVTERRLVEIPLSDDLDPGEKGEILGYLESHLKGDGSVYPNPDCGIHDFNEIVAKIEGFFWIPPDKNTLEETYKDAPNAVKDAVRAAFIASQEQSVEDYGYVLIGFF